MGLFSRNKKNEGLEFETREYNPILASLKYSLFGSTPTVSSNNMKVATVYRCVNLISDSVATLPLVPYNYVDNWKYIDSESNLYNLFNVQPNSIMSAFQFKKMMIVNLLLNGNTYILIKRTGKNIESLQLLDSNKIQVIVEKNDIKYKNFDTKTIYDKSQIIHLINYSDNGIIGESTISYASTALQINKNIDALLKTQSGNGMMVAGILKPVQGVQINQTKADAAKAKFNSVNTVDGNSIIVLDSGFDFQQISLSNRDSQILESSKLSSNDICKFFGVPPSLIYNETGKYSTAEQQQLDYLNNTLTPLIEKIESEFFRKIYLSTDWKMRELRFDVTNLMRLDATTQASYYKTLFEMGALTVNEVRQKINADYPATGGNKHFISTNLQELNNLIVNQKNSIDNKLL